MAVTKRTRYEVLRRDNYTCRYCRSTDNPLTIDHVTPVALGGSDEPSNLVAACRDCNAGKSSSTPDATLVAEVSDDALRMAELTMGAYAVLVEKIGEQDDYIDTFADEFPAHRVPEGWKGTLARWHGMGVPIEVVIDAGRRSDARTYDRPEQWFRYLCGTVWNQVGAVTEEVKRRMDWDGRWYTEEGIEAVQQEAYTIGLNIQRDKDADRIDELECAVIPDQMMSNHVDGLHAKLRASADWWWSTHPHARDRIDA